MTPPSHTVALAIASDHPAFAGHFPGRPLLPGVALLSAVLEAVLAEPALAAAVGAAPRLAAVKFLAPVGPGAALTIRFDATGPSTLRFEVAEGARVAASGSFERAAATVSSAASANPPTALP
jgi:3-hydroxymyristoyl/3-hydroxydecanoyl-(acyl carrier protein) dehydratase